MRHPDLELYCYGPFVSLFAWFFLFSYLNVLRPFFHCLLHGKHFMHGDEKILCERSHIKGKHILVCESCYALVYISAQQHYEN
jgi:hypothetical protein